MTHRLKNKLCVITGAGRQGGIGQAIAKVFAQNGAKLILLDILSIHDASLNEDIKSATLLTIKCDLSSENNIINAMKLIKNKINNKSIDVLVNNAAIFTAKNILIASESDWTDTFNVNVRGYALMMKHTIPMMTKGGSIINIASVNGIRALITDYATYSNTKAAIIQLTKSVAVDIWGKYGIRVNAVSPGFIKTKLHEEHVEMMVKEGKYKDYDDFFQIYEKRLIMKRFGKPQEIGSTCLFFASDDSTYCTGTTLICDGGLSAL